MRSVLLLDTETSSLDATTGHLLEVAVMRLSVSPCTELASAAWLVKAPSNEAEAINGIPVAALAYGYERSQVEERVAVWAKTADAIVAHGDFDQKWFAELGKPWIDSCSDLEYPKASPSRSLTTLCLAHGLGVSEAHRAMPDVRMLARLFQRCAELGTDVEKMLARGLRPKAKFAVAETNFDEARNELAKAARFRWEKPYWVRTMAIEDTASLPFKVREVTP